MIKELVLKKKTSTFYCLTLCKKSFYFIFQKELFKEIDSIFNGSNRSITLQDLNEMKYLERVIKEALRLYPSVAFIGRRLSEDIELGKFHFSVYNF